MDSADTQDISELIAKCGYVTAHTVAAYLVGFHSYQPSIAQHKAYRLLSRLSKLSYVKATREGQTKIFSLTRRALIELSASDPQLCSIRPKYPATRGTSINYKHRIASDCLTILLAGVRNRMANDFRRWRSELCCLRMSGYYAQNFSKVPDGVVELQDGKIIWIETDKSHRRPSDMSQIVTFIRNHLGTGLTGERNCHSLFWLCSHNAFTHALRVLTDELEASVHQRAFGVEALLDMEKISLSGQSGCGVIYLIKFDFSNLGKYVEQCSDALGELLYLNE